MNALDRLACRLRGHRWEQQSDPAGTITFCSRCGKLRHGGGSREIPRGAADIPDPPGSDVAGGGDR